MQRLPARSSARWALLLLARRQPLRRHTTRHTICATSNRRPRPKLAVIPARAQVLVQVPVPVLALALVQVLVLALVLPLVPVRARALVATALHRAAQAPLPPLQRPVPAQVPSQTARTATLLSLLTATPALQARRQAQMKRRRQLPTPNRRSLRPQTTLTQPLTWAQEQARAQALPVTA